MRQILQRHRWATLLVVGLLLFATSGLMLSRMTCLMSGRSVLAVGMAEDCCPDTERHAGATVSPICCVSGHATADVEPFMSTESLDHWVVTEWPLGSVVEMPVEFAEVRVHASIRDRAPPLLPKARLALFATFRI